MDLSTTLQLAQGSEPAGGAAVGQIVIATAGATLLTAALMFLGMGHRSGKVKLLGQWADLSERVSGLPGWTALPAGIGAVSLIIAVFGMYWDIALHIGVGRDEGPLANPAHYFILAGLFGIFSAGFFAMVLPKERPSATAGKHRATTGMRRWAACWSAPAAPSRCSASRSTTSGTASSART